MSSVPTATRGSFTPPRPAGLEHLSVDPSFVSDLALKIIYSGGVMTGAAVASTMCLPFHNVTDRVLEGLKAGSLIEVRGGAGPLAVGYRYAITDKGLEKVRDLRDLLDLLVDIARFLGVRPILAKDLIDLACNSYFVKL